MLSFNFSSICQNIVFWLSREILLNFLVQVMAILRNVDLLGNLLHIFINPIDLLFLFFDLLSYPCLFLRLRLDKCVVFILNVSLLLQRFLHLLQIFKLYIQIHNFLAQFVILYGYLVNFIFYCGCFILNLFDVLQSVSLCKFSYDSHIVRIGL